MQGSEVETKVGLSARMREERWRLLLIAAVVTVAGLMLAFANKLPVSGKTDPAGHAQVKRKAEIDRRFKEGVRMLQAKEYDYALTAFHRVLELAPEMPEAHVNAGYALLGLGKAKAAKDFFDSATVLRPNQLNAYFGLAEALSELGDDFGAMQAMETYVHLAPEDDPFRRKAQAAAWELRGKLDEEKAWFKAAESGGEGAMAGGKP